MVGLCKHDPTLWDAVVGARGVKWPGPDHEKHRSLVGRVRGWRCLCTLGVSAWCGWGKWVGKGPVLQFYKLCKGGGGEGGGGWDSVQGGKVVVVQKASALRSSPADICLGTDRAQCKLPCRLKLLLTCRF